MILPTGFKPYSSFSLALEELILAVMGIYFVFLRSPLLPEDVRYIGLPLSILNSQGAGISKWLTKVFIVMGGYIFSTGILLINVAYTSFKNRIPSSFLLVCIVGLTSIVSMTIINFIINSDFKWILLAFNVPWFLALGFYLCHE